MQFHKDGTLPQEGMVFVFGSNLRGRHGAGAAKVAVSKFGAIEGRAVGRQGNAYAIPTKDTFIRAMPIKYITPYIEEFVRYAALHRETRFFVTRVGCVLAKHADREIAAIVLKAAREIGYDLENCSFAGEWEGFLLELEGATSC